MERGLTASEIDELLLSQVFGHLACIDGTRPYVLPLAYVFHDDVLYGQTTEGKKTDILRKNPLVCFQVQHQQEREWRSAICWGSFEEMDFDKLEQSEAMHLFELLTEKIGSIQTDVGIALPAFSFDSKATAVTVNGRKSTLFRIPVTEKTGRLYSAN